MPRVVAERNPNPNASHQEASGMQTLKRVPRRRHVNRNPARLDMRLILQHARANKSTIHARTLGLF
jgi:hypothetical protein